MGTETLDIDLLVAPGEKSQLLGGRRFDSAPGLYLALHSNPLNVSVIAETTGGESISIHACIPDLEAALILKALAWKKRRSDKDLVDLHSLLEIRQQHRRTETTWRMNDTDRVATGTRLAAASALHELIDLAAREQLSGLGPATLQSRFAALIKSHVAQPR
ncbi:hypothetical protein [Rhodococcus sp. H29-C3]|uniref:hypothetical protein n=1 Tax=Rhodococcus sp. H29-C3 TaxID=3046307 RepID=UPI0024B99BFE|nr:hypothetical protein [Rhodococcus sp. H29-C3]MDJ0362324.1 hypothetical protein [Rhodococcus sp. H29-C3]